MPESLAISTAFTRSLREGIDFNLAYIPDDYVPAGRESFDRAEMNQLFDLGFEAARNGNRWQQLTPGLRAMPVETAYARQLGASRCVL